MSAEPHFNSGFDQTWEAPLPGHTCSSGVELTALTSRSVKVISLFLYLLAAQHNSRKLVHVLYSVLFPLHILSLFAPKLTLKTFNKLNHI